MIEVDPASSALAVSFAREVVVAVEARARGVVVVVRSELGLVVVRDPERREVC
jgi:hypothetical protein